MSKKRTVECTCCKGLGQVEDAADDVLGNTIEFVRECEYCEGDGKIHEHHITCESCNKEEWVARKDNKCDDCHRDEVLREFGFISEDNLIGEERDETVASELISKSVVLNDKNN